MSTYIFPNSPIGIIAAEADSVGVARQRAIMSMRRTIGEAWSRAGNKERIQWLRELQDRTQDYCMTTTPIKTGAAEGTIIWNSSILPEWLWNVASTYFNQSVY